MKLTIFFILFTMLTGCVAGSDTTVEERDLQCDPCLPNYAAYACQPAHECIDFVCPQGVVGYCTTGADETDLRFATNSSK